MGNITKTMDSVFDGCMEDEIEFDTIFDQEDSIIDTVNGVNEAGDPLTGVDFVELHQTEDDGVTPNDIADELGEGNDNRFGAPNPEGSRRQKQEDYSVKDDIDKRLDSDRFYDGTEDEYQSGLKYQKPDENDMESTIDKVIEGCDGGECEPDIDQELDPEDEKDIDSRLDDGEDIEEACGSRRNCEADEEYMDDDELMEACGSKKEACGSKRNCEADEEYMDDDELMEACGSRKEACGSKKEACGSKRNCEADEEYPDDDELLEGCKRKKVSESISGADSDVEDVVMDEEDSEGADIDSILDEKGTPSRNLDYELSDEELIDIAINEK